LDRGKFPVLFFFKPDRQTVPLLAVCRKNGTKKIEKNFSVFQFSGSHKVSFDISTVCL